MRENYIDYGKALLTIMVIAVHAGLAGMDSWSYVRMIFFFFVTGYTYTAGKRILSAGITRRFTGIMLPFWKILFITAFLDVARAVYLGYGDYNMIKANMMFSVYLSGLVPKVLSFSNFFVYSVLHRAVHPAMPYSYPVITPLNCHLWFLVAMFSGCVLFFTYMEKLRRHKYYDIPAILIMLFIASLESPSTVQFPVSLGRGCIACACMIAAVNAKEFNILSAKKFSKKIIAGLIAACVCAFAILNGANKCAFIMSIYGDGSFLSVLIVYIGGVSASILILYLMQLLEHYWQSPVLSFIGRNTMTLYLWNIILNTIFSILLLKIINRDPVMDAFDMSLFTPDSYALILITTALTVITGTLMARYKKSHSESILAKII
ncbi:MAG: acyltransferase family protein [Synergistaceae bacterium]|nr:acyltransferase family protein [Synergistaceae bacterium]